MISYGLGCLSLDTQQLTAHECTTPCDNADLKCYTSLDACLLTHSNPQLMNDGSSNTACRNAYLKCYTQGSC